MTPAFKIVHDVNRPMIIVKKPPNWRILEMFFLM